MFQGAEVGVFAAGAGAVFLQYEAVERMSGRDGGDDDTDVLFKDGPEYHGRAVPYRGKSLELSFFRGEKGEG